MRSTASIFVMVLTLALASCTPPPRVTHASAARFGDDAALPPELARVLRDYEAAWRAKDASALAALFAEDGFVLSNGSPAVRGRANIERHYAGAGGPLHLRAVAWAMQGAIGYIVGEYDQHADFANPGKFTLTLVRDHDARWRIFSDMDNGNTRPPPSPQPPPQPQSQDSSP